MCVACDFYSIYNCHDLIDYLSAIATLDYGHNLSGMCTCKRRSVSKTQVAFKAYRQPRAQVLSPTRLSRSVGTGWREPWEQGWLIACFYLRAEPPFS